VLNIYINLKQICQKRETWELKIASGEIVAFTDDDCEVDKN